jgi:hypothetical protein
MHGCAATSNPPSAPAVIQEPATKTPPSPQGQGFSATGCAQADSGIKLSMTDRFIVLQGSICPGDDKRFKAFLATVPPSIRLIKLSSGGGNGRAAQVMGVMIREAGYNTYVDATRDRCASACTHIFAAGVERFYTGSAEIKTGRDGRVGLGYHYLNSRRPEQTDEEKDNIFNATAAVYLKKMLSPAAVAAATALMSENRTTKMTWLNGNEALQVGIATSLAAPP